jgi:pimeloyl-ACP methyl ester carboxylesterase
METKFIEVAGFSIAYIEKNETAPNAVFFIHGNSGSCKIWEKQFNSPAFNNYHLIAIDLPGHGLSSKSNNPRGDYSPLGTAAILVQILKEIVHSKPFALVGFSYGTNLIAEMLNHDIEPKGIVFAGACIIGKGFEMEIFTVEEAIYFQETVSNEKAITFLSAHLHNQKNIALYADAYFKTDTLFRNTLVQSAAHGNISDEIELLKKQNIDVIIINGAEDKFVSNSYMEETGIRLWKNKVFKLPGSGHFIHTDQPDAFNQLMAEYCNESFTTNHA